MVLLLIVAGIFAMIGYGMDIKVGVDKTKSGQQLTPDESWDMWTGIITVSVFVIILIALS